MATRRAIRGVLRNFLGTYMSRYTDYNGYWLFGFLVKELDELRLDLLRSTDLEPDSPLGVAARTAASRFAEQRDKAGITPSWICDAWLTLRKSDDTALIGPEPHARLGFRAEFMVEAVMDSGQRFRKESMAYVAPHDAEVEFRSFHAD